MSTDAAAPPRTAEQADVVVVGAGPAGSATALHAARAGLDVVLLEKAHFPREKVCGDGLTPRAVRQLVAMGIDTSPEAGWLRNRGLRIIGAGHRLELDWPDLADYPGYGLVRPRSDFDELLARHAEKAGARLLEGANVTGVTRDERTGRVTGVTTKDGRAFAAPVVVAADGNSSPLARVIGRHRRGDRPMGVAYRRYYTSPRHDDDYLESWLELWDGQRLLPGYGWIFGMGDGTSNVGLGILNTSASFKNVDYKDLLARWLAPMPAEWQYDEAHATGPVRGSALPMGFNRQPHYADGVLLVGDSGGMVNPMNGEGIAYALEGGALAAEVLVQALARPTGPSRERALVGYPTALKQQWGGYFTLGRAFVELIGHPSVMRIATRHGLPHPRGMRIVLKLLANLTDPRGGDAVDRVINALAKAAPAA